MDEQIPDVGGRTCVSSINSLLTLLASLGVTGLLVVFGFLAEAGRESLLGVQFFDTSYERYAYASAYFCIHSLVLLIRVAASHPLVSLAVIALYGGVTYVLAFKRLTRASLILAVVAAVLVIGVRGGYLLASVQAPLYEVDGVLTRGASADRTFAGTGAEQSAWLWRALLCAHDARTPHRLGCEDHERVETTLVRWYGLHLAEVIGLVVVYAGFLYLTTGAARRAGHERVGGVTARVAGPFLALVVCGNALMLPYVHAKAAPRLDYKRVSVCLAGTDCKQQLRQGFLLHQSSAGVTLYVQDEAQYAVESYASSVVSGIVHQPSSSLNVLEQHIQLTGDQQAAEN